MKQEIECSNCKHEFLAQGWVNGSCPKCGKTFIWDSMCTDKDEYCFPDWQPDYLPEFVEDNNGTDSRVQSTSKKVM